MDTVAEILRIDPGNEWAQGQFRRVRDNSSGDIDGWNLAERLSTWWELAKRNVADTGLGAVTLIEIFREHLVLLVAILVALLVLVSPLTHAIIQGFSPRRALSGRLERFRLHEILTLISTHNRTGVLLLHTSTARGKIYFDKGEVYHCKCGRASGRAAVQNLLQDPKQGYFVFKDGVLSKDETIDTPLSLILLGLPERGGSVTAQSLLRQQKQQQQSRMKSLLNQKD